MKLCGGDVVGLEAVLVVSFMAEVQQTELQTPAEVSRDMLMSDGQCEVFLQRLLVCRRPSECINYVEQGLVLTLAVSFMAEVQQTELQTLAEVSRDMLMSDGQCEVFLERLLVCLRPSEGINYVEQGLVLTLAGLIMVEVQ